MEETLASAFPNFRLGMSAILPYCVLDRRSGKVRLLQEMRSTDAKMPAPSGRDS